MTQSLLPIFVVAFSTIAVAAEPFRPVTVIPRPFPAITDVKTMTARQASHTLQDDELVLGVSIDGKSRAYPINMLTGPRREIINDVVGGAAIAATW